MAESAFARFPGHKNGHFSHSEDAAELFGHTIDDTETADTVDFGAVSGTLIVRTAHDIAVIPFPIDIIMIRMSVHRLPLSGRTAKGKALNAPSVSAFIGG